MNTDKKLVVVTGGAGFIGSNLCKNLFNSGHEVISLDNYFTGSKENHIEGVTYIEGHTKDISSLISKVPDIIYHLGEYSRVEKSLEEPDSVWDLNVRGTFGVLEFWRKNKCKLVYAGSSTKFGDGGLGRDQSPYAWTKASNTELVQNYSDWYNLPFATTYFYNVYGPGERSGSYGTVIEIFRCKVQNKEVLSVVSPGTQKRNFTHIDDIIEGILLVGEKGEGDNFGIGANEAYSIMEVADLFGAEVKMLPERQGNRMSARLDTSKVRALGWKQKNSLPGYIHSSLKEFSA